jgi:hypothetical protein
MKLPPTAATRGFKEQLSRLEPVRTELAPTKFIMRPFRLGVEDYVNQRAGTVFTVRCVASAAIKNQQLWKAAKFGNALFSFMGCLHLPHTKTGMRWSLTLSQKRPRITLDAGAIYAIDSMHHNIVHAPRCVRSQEHRRAIGALRELTHPRRGSPRPAACGRHSVRSPDALSNGLLIPRTRWQRLGMIRSQSERGPSDAKTPSAGAVRLGH